MKKIKIAQIGTSGNSHGCEIFRGLRRRDDLFEVVGYAFLENERVYTPDYEMTLYALLQQCCRKDDNA